jgi:hypothetical protein
MKFVIIPVVAAILCMGCKSTVNHLPGGINKIDMAFFDSVRHNSDTGFTRIIGAGEFYSAEQYYTGDSIVSKIMKDTAGRITAFVQFHKNTRTAYAEYYSNGQLKAKLLPDSQGRFDGRATYYYEDGRIKSEGVYDKGLFSGTWKNYSVEGVLVSTDEYDANGQLIRSVGLNR